MRQIDLYYKLPVFGYTDIDEYYEEGSPVGKLSNLTTPVLCINAADDPFSPFYGNLDYVNSLVLKLQFISGLLIIYFYIRV